MIYKGVNIYINAKSYSKWSIDENGKMVDLIHDYLGYDFVEYQASITDSLGNEVDVVESAPTLDDCKGQIDLFLANNEI